MRIPCPLCGMRDLREFSVRGVALPEPEGAAWSAAWDDYLHNRDNPAGESREFWYHGQGCGAWLVVTRDTVTHEIADVVLAGAEAGA